jgi:hypothetical protein
MCLKSIALSISDNEGRFYFVCGSDNDAVNGAPILMSGFAILTDMDDDKQMERRNP